MTRAGVRLATGAAAALLVLGPGPAWPQLDQLLRGLGGASQGSGLSDVKIGEGLKEALKVGTEKTVSLTGKTDGYFANQAINALRVYARPGLCQSTWPMKNGPNDCR